MSRLGEFTFEDLDRRLLGSVFLVVGALGVVATFVLTTLGILDHTYEVTVSFEEVTGLSEGAPVTMAGIEVGEVSSIEPDFEQGLVDVRLSIDEGVELGPDTRARLGALTLFGNQMVRLEGPVVEPLLADGARIPLERTSNSMGIVEAIDNATQTAQQVDGGLLDDTLGILADVAESNRGQLGGLFTDLETVAGALASREDQLASLLTSAQTVTATLSAKDRELLRLVDSAAVLLDELARREEVLGRALGDGSAAVHELRAFLAANRQQLVDVIADVDVLGTGLVDQLDDLDRTLAYIGPTFAGLSAAGDDGFLNFYGTSFGPPSEEGP